MRAKIVAVVLSGGGSRGALEAGALLGLMECGIRPQILVGSSVGAINAVAIAMDPTIRGAQRIATEWLEAYKWHIFPTNYVAMAWNLIKGKNSLLGNRRLMRYVRERILRKARRFSDIKSADLYIVAELLDTGLLRVFGKDRNEPLLDAIMSSTAVVPYLPPWEYEGRQYIDGSFVSELPIRVAVEARATEIYAIDVGVHRRPHGPLKGLLRILEQIIATESYGRLIRDLDWGKRIPPDAFHYISISSFEHVRLWDFKHSAGMIKIGRQKVKEYLARSQGDFRQPEERKSARRSGSLY